jgi:Domain of unknown function (DUF4450)
MRKIFLVILLLVAKNIFSQQLWHGIQRTLRYHPEGNDIVIENGDKRFNRALYGGNTAFRAEAGDLPEFALYMPGMGGNIHFGIINGGKSKWLIQSNYIKAIYRPGSMLYEIKDPILNGGIIYLDAIAFYDKEGLVIQLKTKNIPAAVELVVVYGGATGKKFSRDGDIGADPESSFYLKPEYCTDNIYRINKNLFTLSYGFSKSLTEEERYEVQYAPVDSTKRNNKVSEGKEMSGVFPDGTSLQITNANALQSPLSVLNADSSSEPVIAGKRSLKPDDELYFYIGKQDDNGLIQYAELSELFEKAELQREQLASRIKINTPDPYINTLGSVLSIAADAIWESPSYMHGAVAWRMRLNGWRGPYIADVFGWHDRAREHFNNYAKSQLTVPPVTGVVMDTALHLARHLEKIGTALFSDGYICRNPNDTTRANHYDMNLVFIDELLDHFNWTGDTAYVKQVWPLIKRHLAWEKRNFDADGDGLYDAYAAIWASDALQYSGGGVTHSSAYNYRANKTAAELAKLIGEDGTIYEKEADKILSAVNKQLWMPGQGWYAEYKDLLGDKLIHPSAGLWTIYHAIDEGISDPFQSYQSLRYIDNYIPHIPIRAKGLKDTSLYTLATTNWQPYTWSLNNVALAENLHTALAYWEGGRNEEAYKLWKGNLIESMYLGSSPGNIEQLSFYDAIRGELYRDFADPIGMAGKSLVEGLFGIKPDALHDTLVVHPGFPEKWNYASWETPDISFDFKRGITNDIYLIRQSFTKILNLEFVISAFKDQVEKIIINGGNITWDMDTTSIGGPMIKLKIPASKEYRIIIYWSGKRFGNLHYNSVLKGPNNLQVDFPPGELLDIYDPQQSVKIIHLKPKGLHVSVYGYTGNRTFFVKVRQGLFAWWQAVSILVKPANNDTSAFPEVNTSGKIFEKIPLRNYFNDKVTNIFKHQYLSPRAPGPTLQLPTQGIGNWCYPLTIAAIDDSGLRKRAGKENEIKTPGEIPFSTPSDTSSNNILFVSQWDNFRDVAVIDLSGSASYLYLLMSGTTNPMQSRITNGAIYINYADGSRDYFPLTNPENWWPIEQDYYIDGFAFKTGAPFPERLHLKDGVFFRGPQEYSSIKGFTNNAINGGAATVIRIKLNPGKELTSLQVNAIANDVIIGLMAATLVR